MAISPTRSLQQIRNGGFRPVVFLGHGLTVALFAATTLVAAAALWRMNNPLRLTLGRQRLRLPPSGVTAYLGVVLVLCKSLASLLYGALVVPLVLFASPRLQLRVAVILATISLTYPLLRTMDLVPTATMIDLAELDNADRAASLKFRFDNEEVLLERALEQIWFGWGRWGRGFIYDDTGRNSSVTDGRWIITLGTYGLFGFIAEFGLLALSVFRAASALRFAGTDRDRRCLAALALIVAINMVDLLPNGFLSPWTWLLAGALLGRAEAALRLAPRLTPAIYGRFDELRPELTGVESDARSSPLNPHA